MSSPRPKPPLLARLSLRTVLVLGAVLAAAVPIGVLAVRLTLIDARQHVVEQGQDNLVLAQSLAAGFDQFLQSQLGAVALVAAEAETGPLDHARLGPILRHALDTHPALATLLVVDARGSGVAFEPMEQAQPGSHVLGTSFADREWFRDMRSAHRPILDQTIVIGRMTGKPVIALRAPILGPTGEFRGAVAGNLQLREVAAMAARVRIGESGHVIVTTADGLILAHPRIELVASRSLARDPLWLEIRNRDTGLVPTFRDGGAERIGAVATVPGTRWKVVASQAAAEIQMQRREALVGSLGWLALAFVAALGPMVLVAVLIARPIRAVVDACRKVAAGHLGTRVGTPAAPAELDGLVSAFDQMARTLEVNETRLREAEVDRRTAEARMRLASIVASSNDAIITETLDGVISSWNKAAETMYGYDAGEMIGQPVSMLVPPGAETATAAALERIARGEPVPQQDATHVRKDGSRLEVSVTISPVRDVSGGLMGLSTIARDVTEMRHTNRALQRTNRALQVINACVDALIRAEEEGELVQQVCRIATEIGGYALAWVGYAEHDGERTVRPIAQAGMAQGSVEALPAAWGSGPVSQEPTGTAIRTGQPAVGRADASDPALAAWPPTAERHGIRAILALPLRKEGVAFGALSIGAADVDAFDPSETDLLRRLADKLAYGILAVRTAHERRQADAERREMVLELSQRVRQLTAVRSIAQLLEEGPPGEEDLLAQVAAALPPAWQRPEIAAARITLGPLDLRTPRFAETPWRLSTRWDLTDGTPGTVEVAYVEERLGPGEGPFQAEERALVQTVAGMLRAHFERRRAVERLRRSEVYFRSLIENAQDVITVLDARGVIVYESPAVRQVLGYAPEELVGKSAFVYLHPDDDRAVVDLFTKTVGQPDVAAAIECRFRHKDGSWRTLQAIGKNLLHDPDIGGVIVNSRDVTGRTSGERIQPGPAEAGSSQIPRP